MLSTFHNPDILTCLANLSSDEVFTPPNITNQMLDTLPKELWSNKDATFLDPVSKSGVFLREIISNERFRSRAVSYTHLTLPTKA